MQFFFGLWFLDWLQESSLKWKYFVLLNKSYQKPFLFSVTVFFSLSNIYPKFKFTANIALTYAISIVNWLF